MLYSSPLPYVVNAGDYYAAIEELPWAIWLDSGGMDRYDILVAQPITTLVTLGLNTTIENVTGVRVSDDDPFDLLREQLGPHISSIPDIPFAGGALGYWGYDLSRQWMGVAERNANTDDLPDMAVAIYDWAILIDHQEREARLVSRLCSSETLKVLPSILERLHRKAVIKNNNFSVLAPVQSNLSQDDYNIAFEQIQDYLIAGDCYQVNLAQRFTAPVSGDVLQAYMSMRAITPSPHSAFLNLPQAQILSVSPERFLQLRDGKVETKPIKGTRKRGNNVGHDEQLIADLRSNKKDRAENLMIVDLLRNDLNKNCAPGSVQVDNLFEVESYANVHHLVSKITGTLASEKDALALLRDCFPGGSITGAPKKRAMEIIEQLEPHRRGVYCGSIAYIGWDEQMDSSIVIRTLICSNGIINFSVGGGIVSDSTAAEEYQETLDKAAGIFKMLALYGDTSRTLK